MNITALEIEYRAFNHSYGSKDYTLIVVSYHQEGKFVRSVIKRFGSAGKAGVYQYVKNASEALVLDICKTRGKNGYVITGHLSFRISHEFNTEDLSSFREQITDTRNVAMFDNMVTFIKKNIADQAVLTPDMITPPKASVEPEAPAEPVVNATDLNPYYGMF